MGKSITFIGGLPGAGKSTLGENLENMMDSNIIHCDYDKVFESVFSVPSALTRIGKSAFIPEKDKVPFILGERAEIVRLLTHDALLFALFQGAIFQMSLQVLEQAQKTRGRAIGIVSCDLTTPDSRKVVRQQAALEGYDQVDYIELHASRKELVNVAHKRVFEYGKQANIVLSGEKDIPATKKKSPIEVVKAIKNFTPYNPKEKLFRRYIRLERDFLNLGHIQEWLTSK